MTKIKTVMPAMARPLLEPHLPAEIDAHWFFHREEALGMIGDAEVAWADMNVATQMKEVIGAGKNLKWVSTIYAGLDAFPIDHLKSIGTTVTNGVGINTIAVAEYTILGMLSIAKGYADVVRATDKREWLTASPGTFELLDSKALIIGYGAIGAAIGDRLKAFGVEVTGVARTARPDDGIIASDQWQSRIGEFDWIVLAMPATPETVGMFGAEQLAAMKPTARFINIARGTCVDQDALIDVLKNRKIAGAFLDVVTPEPLPEDHALWSLPNTQLSMHLSGRAQEKMFQRAGSLFIENIGRYLAGEDLLNKVDLNLGY